jgi:hypothetical protein
MERTIGNLGQEIKQPSNPYANLSECGLQRSRVNALKALMPSLENEKPTLSQGALDLGNGYALLRAQECTAHAVDTLSEQLIRDYIVAIQEDLGHEIASTWTPKVV